MEGLLSHRCSSPVLLLHWANVSTGTIFTTIPPSSPNARAALKSILFSAIAALTFADVFSADAAGPSASTAAVSASGTVSHAFWKSIFILRVKVWGRVSPRPRAALVRHLRFDRVHQRHPDASGRDEVRSTHGADAGFLTEIAPRYPEAAGELRAAAKEFAADADTLDRAEPLIRWSSPEQSADRNAKLWPLLAAARDHYATSIAHIEKALPRLTHG